MVTEKNLTVLKCIKWKCSQNMPVFSFTGYNTVKFSVTHRDNVCIYTHYTWRYLFLRMRMNAVSSQMSSPVGRTG